MIDCQFCRDGFTPEQIAEARAVIDRATGDLGSLTVGQTIDLLLDNLPWLQSTIEARHLWIDLGD